LSSRDEQAGLQLAEGDLVVRRRREQVAIGVEGHLDRRMPHQGLHALRRETLLDEQGRRGMPQRVQPVFRARRIGREPGGELARARPRVWMLVFGIVLSGVLTQAGSLPACLWGSAVMLAICLGLVFLLPTEVGIRHGAMAAAE